MNTRHSSRAGRRPLDYSFIHSQWWWRWWCCQWYWFGW